MPADPRRERGARGEALASALLEERGYRILARNLRAGRNEIDVVALEGGALCFVEVRSRSGDRFGRAVESVDRHKRKRLVTAAREALHQQRWPTHRSVRFDVVGVDLSIDPPALELIRNAFSADSY